VEVEVVCLLILPEANLSKGFQIPSGGPGNNSSARRKQN
jgi:hypothetical protein